MRRNHNSDNHNRAIPWIKRNVSFLSWAGGLLAASFWIGWYVGSNNSKMEMYEKFILLKVSKIKNCGR